MDTNAVAIASMIHRLQYYYSRQPPGKIAVAAAKDIRSVDWGETAAAVAKKGCWGHLCD